VRDLGASITNVPLSQPLPRLTKILWGLGPLGANTVLSLIGTQFLLYLTDYVGLGPAVAGGILFVAKMGDAFTDFAVGVASDGINTRWGRRRPWLLGGTILITLACPLMFHIDGLAPALRVVLAVGAILIFYTGYSMFYVPHQAMSAEMTQDYEERTSIVSWLYFFGAVSFVVGVSVAPALIDGFGGGLRGFHGMAWLIAAVPLATGLACVVGTRNAPATLKTVGVRTPMRAWFASLAGNKPLMILILSKTIHYFSVGTLTTGLVYFTLYVMKIGQSGMIIAGSVMTAGSLSGLYFFVQLSRHIQKHVIYSLALLGMGIAALSFSLLGYGSGRIAFGVVCFAYGVAGAGLVMAQSMIPDVLEWDYKRTGLRREGAVASMISAIGKAMPAFASLLVGVLLSTHGYISGHPGVAQPASALEAIYLCVSVIPGALLIGAAVILYLFYDLTRERLEGGFVR
jgi:GPH family glycoside/pentoside/hexuronide:cation symporter